MGEEAPGEGGERVEVLPCRRGWRKEGDRRKLISSSGSSVVATSCASRIVTTGLVEELEGVGSSGSVGGSVSESEGGGRSVVGGRRGEGSSLRRVEMRSLSCCSCFIHAARSVSYVSACTSSTSQLWRAGTETQSGTHLFSRLLLALPQLPLDPLQLLPFGLPPFLLLAQPPHLFLRPTHLLLSLLQLALQQLQLIIFRIRRGLEGGVGVEEGGVGGLEVGEGLPFGREERDQLIPRQLAQLSVRATSFAGER